MGFDVAAFIGCDSFEDVFKGVCNDKASKLYEISENDTMNDPRDVWPIEGKFYRKKFLNGKPFAVKVIGIVNLTTSYYLSLEEAKIMQGLNHPNLVEICNVLTVFPNTLYIIMEYLEAGTLAQKLHTLRIENKNLYEKQTINLFKQLSNGLEYLRKQNIADGDINVQNIMFTRIPNGQLRLKYMDFGFSRHLNDAKDHIKRLGNVFNHIIDITIFYTQSFEIRIKQIANQMTNGSYSDMEILARDLEAIYPTDPYNLFVRLQFGGWSV
jgi:serine/threonine protein kinase